MLKKHHAMRYIIFLLLLLTTACKNDPPPCDSPTKNLEEVLSGTWELKEVKGWPYSTDVFVSVPDSWRFKELFIGKDGSYQHSDNPQTTYELKVRNNETFLCPSYDQYGWAIIDYDECRLIFRLDGNDEGPFYMKYQRKD